MNLDNAFEGEHLVGENKKHNAELVEFTIFFAVMLLTCVVGIIELLPEFDKIKGMFGFASVSTLYFVFLIGIFFSTIEFFWTIEKNEDKIEEMKKRGVAFSQIEFFYDHTKLIKILFYITFLLIFITLYFVKIGFLQ